MRYCVHVNKICTDEGTDGQTRRTDSRKHNVFDDTVRDEGIKTLEVSNSQNAMNNTVIQHSSQDGQCPKMTKDKHNKV